MQAEGTVAPTTGNAGRRASALASLVSGLILVIGLVLLIIQRGPPGI